MRTLSKRRKRVASNYPRLDTGLLGAIKSASILCGGELVSVVDLLHSPSTYEENRYVIEANGIKLFRPRLEVCLFVNGPVAASKLLRGTRWQFLPINDVLRVRYGAAKSRCLMNGIETTGFSILAERIMWEY